MRVGQTMRARSGNTGIAAIIAATPKPQRMDTSASAAAKQRARQLRPLPVGRKAGLHAVVGQFGTLGQDHALAGPPDAVHDAGVDVGAHSQAPSAIRTAETVKMTGQRRNGRKATRKPVKSETVASTSRVTTATA